VRSETAPLLLALQLVLDSLELTCCAHCDLLTPTGRLSHSALGFPTSPFHRSTPSLRQLRRPPSFSRRLSASKRTRLGSSASTARSRQGRSLHRFKGRPATHRVSTSGEIIQKGATSTTEGASEQRRSTSVRPHRLHRESRGYHRGLMWSTRESGGRTTKDGQRDERGCGK
jgi:hypothetical protein